MYQVSLSKPAADKLLAVDPSTERNGGFQQLTVALRRQYDPNTGILQVNHSDLERINRYKKKYGGGGWQRLLREIPTPRPNP